VKIGDLLVECDLGNVNVETYRDCVCPLSAAKLESNFMLRVEKELPLDCEEKAAKFNDGVKSLVEGIANVSIKVGCKLGAGSAYKTISGIVPIKEGGPMDLVHKEGEVWLVDFWATWCPPCQKPMAHNQKMLEDNAESWGKDIRIIGISIDQTKEPVLAHCESKNWMSVEHYHKAGSDCSEVYSVQGVPHVMLIDKSGKIVFKGHPASRDIEKDLNALKAGEVLTGEGVATAAAGGADEAEDPAFKPVDADLINKEIDSFAEIAEAMQKDAEISELAKKFARAFCVMVFTQKYNPVSKQMKGQYQNYRVLVGPAADLEKLKGILAEKVSGSYELVLREQAM
jgi:thiol-disulfide isomerase/thioredoxin